MAHFGILSELIVNFTASQSIEFVCCSRPGSLSGDDSMSLSILVVDDEPDVAEMFRQRFRRGEQFSIMTTAKILAVDDEPDFELLLRQRFRRQIGEGEFSFRFARHREEAPATLAGEEDIDLLLLDINRPVVAQ
jgi:CheY-like chemotaxis protein